MIKAVSSCIYFVHWTIITSITLHTYLHSLPFFLYLFLYSFLSAINCLSLTYLYMNQPEAPNIDNFFEDTGVEIVEDKHDDPIILLENAKATIKN